MIYVGIDWADSFHLFCVLDQDGHKLDSFKIEHKQTEFDKAHQRILKWAQSVQNAILAIETRDSLLVDFFCELGYSLFFLNPKQTDRFRDRHRMSSSKSDGFDAYVLADALRTDQALFSCLDPLDEQSLKLRVLTRTREALVIRKVAIQNELIATLKRYFPAAVHLLGGVDDPRAVAFLLQFPTHAQAKGAKPSQVIKLLKQAGASEAIARRQADEIRRRLQESQMRPSLSVEKAYVLGALSLLRQMQAILHELSELEQVIKDHYHDHPNKDLINSLPGVKETLGPVLAGELGSNITRFSSLKQLKSYAGTCPVTNQSGKYRGVHIRWACNKHLRRALHLASLTAIRKSLWARERYDRLKSKGKSHARALRAVADQLIEMIYVIFTKRTPYDEAYHLYTCRVHAPKNNRILVKILT